MTVSVPAFRQKSSSNFTHYQKVHEDIAINLKKDLEALKNNLYYKKNKHLFWLHSVNIVREENSLRMSKEIRNIKQNGK